MYLGLDFGTSGARACVLDKNGQIVHENHTTFPKDVNQPPDLWREALHHLLKNLPNEVAQQLQRIAIDATSATVLLCDAELNPVSPALPYHDTRAQSQAAEIKKVAPEGHTASSSSSGLAKFLWLTQNSELKHAAHFMHQADWLSALLTGTGGKSDYHNALKTGYDVERMEWPDWVLKLPHSQILPQVLSPGTKISEISHTMAQRFNINPACTIHAGTTDSIAAFIAANVHKSGHAVTSLGSTLVLKLLTTTRVENSQYGVYSHRYGDLWLAGGASNAGGSVLRQYFSDVELVELSKQIDASIDSPFDYYPLPQPGERFPHNNPDLKPRLTPRPQNSAQFLHGILQALSRIEADGYSKLQELGASKLKMVSTCGGGAKNETWQQIRERLLNVPVNRAHHTEAALGSATLARHEGII